MAAILAPITTDPVVLFSGIAYDLRPSWLPGFTTIDPNQGFTSYALGVRAARDLIGGRLPLWNPFEGLGAPLLGEMNAAALFPPTLLLLLPHGQVIEQAFLQIVAGVGTFLFLRRFGLGATAALTGGLLFEFNGVFAWLRNAIYNPVALLPWLFYAVESLFVASIAGLSRRRRGGMIALGALAASLALYAGFPEVVFYYCMPLSRGSRCARHPCPGDGRWPIWATSSCSASRRWSSRRHCCWHSPSFWPKPMSAAIRMTGSKMR